MKTTTENYIFRDSDNGVSVIGKGDQLRKSRKYTPILDGSTKKRKRYTKIIITILDDFPEDKSLILTLEPSTGRWAIYVEIKVHVSILSVQDFKINFEPRMYSSRMRTTRSLPYGGLPDRDPLNRDPPADRDPRQRHPPCEQNHRQV